MKKMIYLVAVDGSEWSDRAAGRAVSLAEKTGAEVHFITVIASSGNKKLTKKDSEEAEIRAEIFNPLVKRFKDTKIQISYELFWGHPVEVIHKQAKKEHVSMIFVGRRGRSKVVDLLLGSVANSLAHTAGVPIVLVP